MPGNDSNLAGRTFPRWAAGLLQVDDAGRLLRVAPAPLARLVTGLLDGAWRCGPGRPTRMPDAKVLRRLLFRCWQRTDLLGGREATRYAHALLALSAYWRDWLRPLDEYEIPELIGSAELEEEGRAMGHCVATYWPLCESGQSSIWSLTGADAAGGVERLLTLEVRNGERRIVQARGASNRPPDPGELHLLGRWAEVGGPSLSDWLQG